MTLNYNVYGNKDAPLIVFLHGGGVGSWMWDKQIDYFTDYYCLTVDLPEQGLNKHKGKFSIKHSAEKMIELIEQFAYGKEVIVIGFSLGAQVLIKMLSMKRDLIDYAVINSALVKPSKLGEKLISPLISLTYPFIKNKIFAQQQAKALYIKDDYFDLYYNESSQIKQDTLIRILKENMSFALPLTFAKANAKILITVGEKEKQVMKKSAMTLVNSNPNCTGIIISGVGHGASLAKPDLFNLIIEKWLNNTLK